MKLNKKSLRAFFVVMYLIGASMVIGVDLEVAANSSYFFVDPQRVRDIMPPDEFWIKINVTGANATYAWEVVLSWDSTLLNVSSIKEGDFLHRWMWDPFEKKWIPKYATTFVYDGNKLDEANLMGKIRVGCSLQGNLSLTDWASGNGWLFSLGFKVKAYGSSVLNLSEARRWDHIAWDPIKGGYYPTPNPYPDVDGFFTNKHDTAITNVTASPTEVTKPKPVTINVTVANIGDFTETFNVTAYYDEQPVDNPQTVTNLKAGTNKTLTFTWTTTYVPATTNGTTYKISAKASELPNEVNTTNNSFINGNVTIYKPPGPSAKFTYSPETPIKGEPVNFDASISTPDPKTNASIISYTWDFGDGASGSGITATHSYADIGAYPVKLNVTDSEGLWDAAEKTVVVKARPTAQFTYTPSAPVVGQTVTFNASASTDLDGLIVSWNWDFGDGIGGGGEIVTHTFATAGVFTVDLTVTDDDGLTSIETKEVTIGKLSSIISIFPSPTTITIGENATFSGSITPTRPQVNVTIQQRLSGQTEWNTLAVVKTGSTGSYEYTWAPETVGTYEVKAKWAGDANTLGDESETQTIEVLEAPAQLGIPLYLFAGLAIIVAAAIIVYIARFRK